jgi:uncharacterized tellurite resistance protein B-like protein
MFSCRRRTNFASNLERHMNHRHRKVLHSLFSHPVPSNLHLHELESVFREMGGEIGHTSHGRLSVRHKGQMLTVHGSDHGLSKDEVARARKFIESCGVDPVRDYPL